MNAVLLKSILDYRFRTNPEYELVPLDRLASEQRKTVRHLANNPDFYGILIPRKGGWNNTKAVSRGTAHLLSTLNDPGKVPAYARRRPADHCNLMLARLVLDGLLEISREGRFVCGSEAYHLIYGDSPS
ncbi:MAG: hypothetical protein C5B58_09470, partial [Acidobacteria bacterium]